MCSTNTNVNDVFLVLTHILFHIIVDFIENDYQELLTNKLSTMLQLALIMRRFYIKDYSKGLDRTKTVHRDFGFFRVQFIDFHPPPFKKNIISMTPLQKNIF